VKMMYWNILWNNGCALEGPATKAHCGDLRPAACWASLLLSFCYHDGFEFPCS
jgi:hypothetical protein